MGEWIKVTERLPELGKNDESDIVLIKDEDRRILVGCLSVFRKDKYRTEDVYYWSEKSRGCECCCRYCCDGIVATHWMPLPEGVQ